MKQGETKEGGGAGSPRPIWFERLADKGAEMPISKRSPDMYRCACISLWAETQDALQNGDDWLLARDGFADALEFVMNPHNAGSDDEAFPEMLADWRRYMAVERDFSAMLEKEGPTWYEKGISFLKMFAPESDNDGRARGYRRCFLTWRANGDALRKAVAVAAKSPKRIFECKDILDAVLSRHNETEKADSGSVMAYWLNAEFSNFGAALCEWLEVAAIPKPLKALRKAIADNFGVFPAPFEGIYDAAWLAGGELQKLLYVARSQARQRGQLADGLPRSGGEVADGGTGGAMVFKVDSVTINAEEVVTPLPKEKTPGHCGGYSQAEFAAKLRNAKGEAYTVEAVKKWDRKYNQGQIEKMPTAHGVRYTPNLRRNRSEADVWAMNFNLETENKRKARAARLGLYAPIARKKRKGKNIE